MGEALISIDELGTLIATFKHLHPILKYGFRLRIIGKLEELVMSQQNDYSDDEFKAKVQEYLDNVECILNLGMVPLEFDHSILTSENLGPVNCAWIEELRAFVTEIQHYDVASL